MPLRQCEHIFHQECMIEYLTIQIDTRHFPIVCPEASCKLDVNDLDIREILSQTQYQKYSQLITTQAIDQLADMSWCPTPDCQNAFIFDEANSREFKCKSCKKHYCLSCMVPFHTGKSCAEFRRTIKADENDQKFLQFVRGSKFKQCPKCKIWVQKSHGCDHMRCKCGMHFCY